MLAGSGTVTTCGEGVPESNVTETPRDSGVTSPTSGSVIETSRAGSLAKTDPPD